MKNAVFSLFALMTLSTLPSCMDRIDVEVKTQSNSITVDAFINSLRQDQVIRLSKTDNYFSGSIPPFVHGAFVLVKDLDNNRTYLFNDQGDGNYIYKLSDSDTMAYPSHNYELCIEIGSFKYRSVVIGKRSVSIDNLCFDSIGAVTGGKGLKMIARDAKGPVADFYWVKPFVNGKFNNRADQIILEYFGYNNELDGAFFNPMLFSVLNHGNFDELKKGDKVKIEIWGISRNVYEFLNLGKQMSNNGGLFATTPVNLPSNIVPANDITPRATGVFSVSEVTSNEITIN